eukprot:gene12823-12950_t
MHKVPGNIPTPVNFYIYRAQSNVSARGNKLPLLFLMNGANVEAKQYSQIAGLLNGRGYTFIASDYYQPLPPLLQVALANSTRPRAASCPNNKILASTSALLKDFLDYAQQSDDIQLQEIASRGVVLVSHSHGGLVSLEMLAQSCAQPAKAPVVLELCEGMFVLFLGGQYNDNTATAYSNTNTSACACAGYARFPGLNHFGINNFQGDGQDQITPCARPARSDPANFTVSRGRQEQALRQQAALVDSFIQAFVFQDAGHAQLLQQQAGNATRSSGMPAVPAAADQGFMLQLKGQCFNW